MLLVNVNPTVWTLGCAIPVHTQDVKSKYGKGLVINSMEGREIILFPRENVFPKRVGLASFCECDFSKQEECSVCNYKYCSHPYRKSVELSCELGKLTIDKSLFFLLKVISFT